MKVTILVDNTALFDRFFAAEHGFWALRYFMWVT